MILSEENGFCFIHIPKCAGTSLRSQILPIVNNEDPFWGVEERDGLGAIDLAHMPLQLIARTDEDLLHKIEKTPSFAVLRDPIARFASAFTEHLYTYRNARYSMLTEQEAQNYIEDVIRRLEHGDVLEAEYIHFARQTDYVTLDGAQLVQNLYPIEAVDQLLEDIYNISGAEAPPSAPHINTHRFFRTPALTRPLLAINKFAQRVLPDAIRMPIVNIGKSLLMADLKGQTAADHVLASEHITDFVRSYYADDFTLLEHAR